MMCSSTSDDTDVNDSGLYLDGFGRSYISNTGTKVAFPSPLRFDIC